MLRLIFDKVVTFASTKIKFKCKEFEVEEFEEEKRRRKKKNKEDNECPFKMDGRLTECPFKIIF
ncbi:hypothetical protein LguiA_024738 [Lonicera macranthoides]